MIDAAYRELKAQKKLKTFSRWTRFIGLNGGKGWNYSHIRQILLYKKMRSTELELCLLDFLIKLKQKEERARLKHNQKVLEMAFQAGIIQESKRCKNDETTTNPPQRKEKGDPAHENDIWKQNLDEAAGRKVLSGPQGAASILGESREVQ